MDGWMDGWRDVSMSLCIYEYVHTHANIHKLECVFVQNTYTQIYLCVYMKEHEVA